MKLSFKRFSLSAIIRRGWYFWIRHYKSLFTLGFLLLTGFAGYQWHYSLYRYHWTDQERKTYLETTVKETAFQEKKFLDVMDRLKQDREVYQQDVEIGRDLFGGARKKER